VLVPETIGSIVYLSRHLEDLKRRVVAGFVLTCCGDERAWSFLASRRDGTLADRVARHVLRRRAPGFDEYSFLDRGSDERQYCSPGVDLPVVSIMRSKLGSFPEYHTSLDDLSLITPTGLRESYEVVRECLRLLEGNRRWRATKPCEPQHGRRGLYPTLSTSTSGLDVRSMMNLLAYCDGEHDLIAAAERIGGYAGDLIPVAERLARAGVIEAG
jgi:aminopeptidase-like protein